MAAPTPAQCPPRRYYVDEMLSLRNTLPVVNDVVNKLNEHPDIAGLCRVPEEAFNDPEPYSCQYQALVDVTNRRKATRTGSRRIEGSSEESEEQLNSSSKLPNGTRQGQWHLRQRDSSHRSSEPHSAPSGIASQQSENFQRFYRAVVSPTHIRVTAGGRIVPNTRVIAPPKFDWNPDKCLFEPRKTFPDVDLNTPQAQNLWLPNSMRRIGPSLLPPGHLSNFDFRQGTPMAQTTMAAHNLSGLNGHAQTSLENNQPAKEATTDPLPPTNLPQPIKISPPSQFDHSRPFMFNGQVVYPVPAGFQPPPNSIPLPITVLGDPNLQHQVPTSGNFFPPSYPMPVPIPLVMPSGPLGHLPMMFPNGGPHLEGGLPVAPYMSQFTPSLVSLSELTKSQIQGFRNQVKHIDDQLANNTHQVDETFLHRQRSELMVFIEKMETMLHTQLDQETNQVSIAYLNGKTGNTATVANHNGSMETLRKVDVNGGSEGNKSSLSRSSAASNEELKKGLVMVPPVPLFVPSANQPGTHTQSEDAQATKTATESKPSTRPEPATKSRLTVAAAKAPPFQPRAHAIAQRSESESVGETARQTSRDSVPLPNPALSTPQYGAFGNRRTANSSSDCGLTSFTGAHPASLSRIQNMQTFHDLDANQSALLQRAHTFHAPFSTFESASKPYLIGSLPSGMHIGEGSGFIYSRPLTEDEVRARHLYWGDAPRSALKGSGLPKFDGKDFYPPSPVKGMAKPATISSGYPSSTTAPVPAFATLFTKPQSASYHTPPQARAKASEQDHMPTPTRAYMQNDIIGFQSPSPHPATYTFENKLPQNWPSTHYGNCEESNQQKMEQPAANATPLSDDFSTLFTSPSAPQHDHASQIVRGGNLQPTTPQSKAVDGLYESKDDEPESLDSWGAPKNNRGSNYGDLEDLKSIKTNPNDSQSNSSTVEIRLTSNDKVQSPKRASANTLVDRQANLYGGGDSSTLFLQNMLRNTAAATMAAPALSGAISSATAHGYLPSHRGSAAASLAPAMFNTLTTLERQDDSGLMKIDHIKISADGSFEVSTEGVAPLIAANFLPENRPVDRDRPHRPVRASVETLGAEGYLRYLTQKAEVDKKIVEEGWNSNTTGTGPVMGSDW